MIINYSGMRSVLALLYIQYGAHCIPYLFSTYYWYNNIVTECFTIFLMSDHLNMTIDVYKGMFKNNKRNFPNSF